MFGLSKKKRVRRAAHSLPFMTGTLFGERRVPGTRRDGAVPIPRAGTSTVCERVGDYGQERREIWVNADWEKALVGLPVQASKPTLKGFV